MYRMIIYSPWRPRLCKELRLWEKCEESFNNDKQQWNAVCTKEEQEQEEDEEEEHEEDEEKEEEKEEEVLGEGFIVTREAGGAERYSPQARGRGTRPQPGRRLPAPCCR